MLFTVLQLLGLIFVIVSAAMLAGVPGAVGAFGAALVYVGLAGES